MRVPAIVIARAMRVCGTCGEIVGTFTDPYDQITRTQTCGCTSADSSRHPWTGYDLNLAIELCYCCAADVVHSGTLSSPMFCETCLMWVEALNEGEGQVVIPEDRQALLDPSTVGLLGILARMKAYRKHRTLNLVERARSRPAEAAPNPSRPVSSPELGPPVSDFPEAFPYAPPISGETATGEMPLVGFLRTVPEPVFDVFRSFVSWVVPN
jgi:hypothetical protein